MNKFIINFGVEIHEYSYKFIINVGVQVNEYIYKYMTAIIHLLIRNINKCK